jgi:hypothetical protein
MRMKSKNKNKKRKKPSAGAGSFFRSPTTPITPIARPLIQGQLVERTSGSGKQMTPKPSTTGKQFTPKPSTSGKQMPHTPSTSGKQMPHTPSTSGKQISTSGKQISASGKSHPPPAKKARTESPQTKPVLTLKEANDLKDEISRLEPDYQFKVLEILQANGEKLVPDDSGEVEIEIIRSVEKRVSKNTRQFLPFCF